MLHFMFFFFFQAEDGIRDYKVTGVQTCALPISAWRVPARAIAHNDSNGSSDIEIAGSFAITLRSEEHTSELQSPCNLVCRLLLEKKKPDPAESTSFTGHSCVFHRMTDSGSSCGR